MWVWVCMCFSYIFGGSFSCLVILTYSDLLIVLYYLILFYFHSLDAYFLRRKWKGVHLDGGKVGRNRRVEVRGTIFKTYLWKDTFSVKEKIRNCQVLWICISWWLRMLNIIFRFLNIFVLSFENFVILYPYLIMLFVFLDVYFL